MASPALAQTAPELRRIAVNFGLTIPQAQKVFSLVDGQAAQIAALSKARSIDQRTMRAAAERIGVRNPDISAAEFARLLQTQAQQAKTAQTQIARLTDQVNALDPGETRTRALAALARGRAAFDEGRFDDADKAFTGLQSLRETELHAAQTAWGEAVAARAQTAILMLDYDRATELQLESARFERRQRIASRQRETRFYFDAAHAQMQKFWTFADRAAAERAIAIYDIDARTVVSREEDAYNWASLHNNLGNAYASLADFHPNPDYVARGIENFRIALETWTKAVNPRLWAMPAYNLAILLQTEGNRAGKGQRTTESVALFREVLTIWTHDAYPAGWAMAQHGLSKSLYTLAQRENSDALFAEALAAVRATLEPRDPAKTPGNWGSLGLLASIQSFLGERNRDAALLEEAVESQRSLTALIDRTRNPLSWGRNQASLGNSLWRLALLVPSREDLLSQSADAFGQALLELRTDRHAVEWAQVHNSLCIVERLRANGDDGDARLSAARLACEQALTVRTHDAWPFDWAGTSVNLARVLTVIATRTNDRAMLDRAYQTAVEAKAVLDQGGNATSRGFADQTVALLQSLREGGGN